MYSRLAKYFRPYLARFLQAVVCMLLVAGLTALSMWILRDVIDKIFIAKNQKMLFWVAGAVPAIFLLKAIFSYIQTYLIAYIGQQIIKTLRNELFNHLQKLSLDFYHRNPSGKIMARLTNDVQTLQNAITHVPLYFIRDGFTIIFLAGFLFYLNWQFALITPIAILVAGWPIVLFGKKLRSVGRHGQQKMSDVYTSLQENVSGVMVIKAFNMEDYEREKFTRENQNYFNIVMRSLRVEALSTPVMELIGAVSITIIIFWGGWDVIKGVWTAGSFFAFLGACWSTYNPIKNFAQMNNNVQQALSAVERIFSLLDEKPKIQEVDHPIQLCPIEQEIRFQDIWFSYYPGEYILKDINFIINKGEVAALVGPSGVGKTTLINLLARFYDPVQGAIFIDGIDIRQAGKKSLYEQIGIVTQETILFNDTIYNNIAYGRWGASDKEVETAAQMANAHEFIGRLPQGYGTFVGERGVLLSGGQKQRIAIARAILKKPSILILDEATSNLDTESEKLVQEALERLMVRQTTLVIAHRLSTIARADKIVVFNHGRIAQIGRHQELLKQEGIYKKLFELQFSKTTI
ncbi:MAG: ABC transporter ATP-binding protein [Elusimicrobiota bacterium]